MSRGRLKRRARGADLSAPSQHAGRVTEDGTLVVCDRPAWLRAIARLKGREVYLSVRSIRSQDKASHDQHAYYRAAVLPLLAEEWGWSDHGELHYRLKEKHIPAELWVERRIGKALERVPPSSADLTVEQFAAFLQGVIDHATEEGIRVPAPSGSDAA